MIRYGYDLTIYDPIFLKKFYENYKLDLQNRLISKNKYHCIVVSVDHDYFKKMGMSFFQKYLYNNSSIFIDLKNTF